MSEPPEPEPPPEQPYQLPDTQDAWEPDTLPNQPLKASGAACFVPKLIG